MLRNKYTSLSLFLLSALIVGLGQPARIGALGALAAVCGYALFFHSLSDTVSFQGRFWRGVLWFSGIQLLQLSWMTSIEFQGYYILFVYAGLCLLIGMQFGLLAMLVPAKAEIPLGKVLALASFWVLMEWSRLFFLCGFSWNPVGLALTCFLPSLQFASVLGIFGLSFWVMLTNLLGLRGLRKRSGGLFFCVACVPYLFGWWAVSSSKEQSSPRAIDVALVQTNLFPSEKIFLNHRPGDYSDALVQWQNIIRDLEQTHRSQWDLILLPEAAVPYTAEQAYYRFDQVSQFFIAVYGMGVVEHFPPLEPPYARQRFFEGKDILCVSNLFWCQTLANLYQSELIIGLDHREKGKNFNAAFYFRPGGWGYTRYDKQVLLPLAESLPFAALKPLTKSYGIETFFSPGQGPKLFGSNVLYAPSICYEETFSAQMRQSTLKKADLFVNLTNDNYFPDSTLARQHFDHARVRAVENGIPLLRACNRGITAVIDCQGRLCSFFGREVDQGILCAHLPIKKRHTLYSLWGDGGLFWDVRY